MSFEKNYLIFMNLRTKKVRKINFEEKVSSFDIDKNESLLFICFRDSLGILEFNSFEKIQN